jgi:hypothetical protein
MNSARTPWNHFSWILLAVPLLSLGLGACQSGSEDRGEGQKAEPAEDIALQWPRIEGADRYELRAWARDRLLFEESVADTQLVLVESLRRTVAAFDSVEIVVRGLEQGVRLDAEPIRWLRLKSD